jgi:hypothetical protein
MLEKDPTLQIYAWQSGHNRITDISIYGLDNAFPTQMQPELLQQYLHISLQWHKYCGPGIATEGDMKESDGSGKKRKMIDCATQTTPKKTGGGVDLELHEMDTPETKKLKGNIARMTRMIELKREQKQLRAELE